jgi:hypothetical protein
LPDRSDIATVLAILTELQASLEASQQALLARDLAGMEQGTRDQRRLQQALAALWTPRCICEFHGSRDTVQPADFHATAARVHFLGRVQLALLGRALRSLNVLAHLVSGPAASYSPSSGAVAIERAATAGGRHACRA